MHLTTFLRFGARDPHALDFTAADAMDVAASYAIDFTDVYSSWHDFGDAIVP